MTRARYPTEHQEQVMFTRKFELCWPDVWYYAIPNGGKRSIKTAMDLKAEGVKRGVSDLHVPEWSLWIEMKRQKGGSLSPDQKKWKAYLESIGDTVIVGKGADDAMAKIEEFLEEKER